MPYTLTNEDVKAIAKKIEGKILAKGYNKDCKEAYESSSRCVRTLIPLYMQKYYTDDDKPKTDHFQISQQEERVSMVEESTEDRANKLIYGWIKSGTINLPEFTELCNINNNVW